MNNILIENNCKKNIEGLKNCTGCSACANICPAKAITMKENEIGYYVPTIDSEKCINCGKCDKICPELNPREGNKQKPNVYAVQANDKIRYVSSSGGAFTLIAEEILSQGGYVAGVTFDENWKVHHTIINDINDLDKLRRSKYVQSYIREDFYQDIQKILDNDNYVLFSGCPCQVAGLKSYLNKNYEKLLLIDLLCAQCASPKMYRKFINDTYPNEKIKSINFRSKIKGWDAHTVVITDKHPEEEITHNFMKAYVNHLMMNESCKKCKYTTTARQGDLTLGDYWGIGKRAPHLDDRKGTSCLLVNTKKGKKLFSKIKNNFKLVEKRTLKDAMKSNLVLKNYFKPHQNIAIFNKSIDSKNFIQNTDDCLSNKYNVGIVGFWYIPNRGAILTNYALSEAINELGYNARTINYIPENFIPGYENSIAEQFAQKYINLSRKITTRNELKSLNNDMHTFVSGSDQIWRYAFRKEPYGYLFLNFVNNQNKIISYSTSFGTEKYDGPEEARILRKHYLQRYDKISVREYDAVKILKDSFDIDAVQIIDPVFLIHKSKYEKIISESKKNETNFIGYYMLFPNKEKMEVVKKAEKRLGLKSINIEGENSVEDWLYYIKNCEILITDSFHGSCFATIFNRKFIAINPVKEKPTRFETILLITNMMDRLLMHPSEINDKEYLFDDIDWTEANNNLIKQKQIGIEWLKDALNCTKQANLTENGRILDSIINKEEEDIDLLKFSIKVLNNKYKIYWEYYTAKLLFNITTGKLKVKMGNKKNKYKMMVKIIRNYNKNI